MRTRKAQFVVECPRISNAATLASRIVNKHTSSLSLSVLNVVDDADDADDESLDETGVVYCLVPKIAFILLIALGQGEQTPFDPWDGSMYPLRSP